jgi:hypothetical protein
LVGFVFVFGAAVLGAGVVTCFGTDAAGSVVCAWELVDCAVAIDPARIKAPQMVRTFMFVSN